MVNIGKRIKELRKKNDLTQEKLADFLGVTYQAVSKWETGIASPDLSLIAPLTRLLRCTADELLGLTAPETDERKAYFDREYFQFWKKDHEVDLEISRQAVAEYPGDFRYLHWLASNEWYVGYSVKYMGTDTEKELIASSIRHNEMILENCDDNELRNHAISGLMYAYSCTNRHAEAKKYAMMYPEAPESCRDDMLAFCLRGEELETLKKKIVRNSLMKLCSALSELWEYTDNPCSEAMDAEEAVIKAVITDGNYQHFHISLSLIYQARAKNAMLQGNHDGAVTALQTAMKHAEEFDKMDESGTELYTCPVLSGYTVDHSADRKEDWSLVGNTKNCMEDKIFDAIRDRDDFKALLTTK